MANEAMTPLEIEYAIDRLNDHIQKYSRFMKRGEQATMIRARKLMMNALAYSHEGIAKRAARDAGTVPLSEE